MAIVLVVEDDPVSRALHTRIVAGLEGVSVVSTAGFAETASALAYLKPDLVLLDLRLPDGTGVDVLHQLSSLERAPQIVVVSAFLDDLDCHDTTSCHIVQLAKPAPPAEIRRVVETQLASQLPALPFSVAEYVQLTCLGGHSLGIDICSNEGSGRIFVSKGLIWSAQWGDKTGFQALAAAVSASGSRVSLYSNPPDNSPREIAGDWQSLLIEAVRLHDEAARSLQSPLLADDELDFSDLFSPSPLPESPLPQPIETPRNRLVAATALVERGVRSVISRNYSEAIVLFEQALELDPDAAPVRHRLERLRSLVTS